MKRSSKVPKRKPGVSERKVKSVAKSTSTGSTKTAPTRSTRPKRSKKPESILETVERTCASKFEEMVRDYFKAEGIRYQQEYVIPTLPYRRYDFYLPRYNLIVECDGDQHFTINSKYHKGKKGLTITQRLDKLKTWVAVQEGYRILRLDYRDRLVAAETIRPVLKSKECLIYSNPERYTWLSEFMMAEKPFLPEKYWREMKAGKMNN